VAMLSTTRCACSEADNGITMEPSKMITSPNPPQKFYSFSGRRIALLAGITSLGAVVMLTVPTINSKLSLSPSVAHAQNVQRPVGFADIVESVKPAVISVRIRSEVSSRLMGLDGGSGALPQGSPMERFFRRFGIPDGTPGTPNDQRPSRGGRAPVTGQGSGFFISA